MFFGVEILPNKQYEQELEYDLKLSQIALGKKARPGDEAIFEILVEGHAFVVAKLRAGRVDFAPLNLRFIAGSVVSFQNLSSSNASICVVGSYSPPRRDTDSDSDDEFSGERALERSGHPIEELVSPDESSDESSDDEERDGDFDPDDWQNALLDASASDDDDLLEFEPEIIEDEEPSAVFSSDESDSDGDLSDSVERSYEQKRRAQTKKRGRGADQEEPKAKTKSNENTPNKKSRTLSSKKNEASSSTAAATTTTTTTTTPSKKSKEVKSREATPSKKSKESKVVTLKGGLKYEVLKPSAGGPVARIGDRVRVGYVGRIKKTGKVFDKGPNFQFALGAGEVIRGWDVGVAGMRVGEKRRLIIPAGMAYGRDGIRERGRVVIPRNATLVFDVTLNQC